MKFMEKLKGIIINLYSSLKRFPVTLLFSTCAAIMLTIIIEISPKSSADFISMLRRITMIVFLGIPLTLCIQLLYEKYQDKNRYMLAVYYAAAVVLLVLYYFFLLKDTGTVSTIRYAAVAIALIGGFFFIPNLGGENHIEIYTINIFKGFFITAIYSAVLYMGLSAIFLTMNKLLSVYISGKVYAYTFIYICCIFALSYFLAGIPQKGSIHEEGNYPKALRILLLYIVMPLIAVYTLILYIYFVKIIITGQWPVGMVSNLVLWYSVVCAAVMFFITQIEKQDSWAKIFFTWLPRIILPLMAMMFVSIGIRINAYGVTENRYFVVLLGLWSAGIFVYYCFSRNIRNIVLPVTISIIAIFSVFGPFSCFSVSRSSQTARLEKILVKNNMLSGGKISAAPADISREDKKEITSILYYFKDNYSLKEVKYLPDNFKTEDMERVLGFPPESTAYGPVGYFNLSADRSGKAIDISGYQYLLDVPGLYGKTGASKDIGAVYNYENQNIKITYNGNFIYEKNLDDFTQGLAEKYGGSQKGEKVPVEEMTFTDENDKAAVKFIFLNISGERDSFTGETKAKGVDCYILVELKQ